MAEAGLLAYPIVLMAMYGVARLGRRERWDALEWLRLGALCALFGLVLAVQVKFVLIGLAEEPVAFFAAIMSVVGVAALLVMYLWERWQTRVGRAPGAPRDEVAV